MNIRTLRPNADSLPRARRWLGWAIVAAAVLIFGHDAWQRLVFHDPRVGQALLAEGGKDGAELRSQVRVALVLTTALMGVAAVVATVGRELVTVVYGDDYGDASRILPALVV